MLAFQDDEFQFAFERALGASYRQGADVGEVLATSGGSLTVTLTRGCTSGRRRPARCG